VSACGVQLQPLVDAMKAELLTQPVLHADETPVAMLDPGAGKTHRAYCGLTAAPACRRTGWWCSTSPKAAPAGTRPSSSGTPVRRLARHARVRRLLGLQSLVRQRRDRGGLLAHARRKFHELWANHKSPVGEQALALFGKLYDVEREIAHHDPEERWRVRQERPTNCRRVAHVANRPATEGATGSATAKAIDYSLGRWTALVRYLDDARLPADNNWVENQIRPVRSEDPIGCSRGACVRASAPRPS
jgi:hypothetical protein